MSMLTTIVYIQKFKINPPIPDSCFTQYFHDFVAVCVRVYLTL